MKRKSHSLDQGKRRKTVTVLEPGWKGVFVTCNRGKESQCKNEAVQLFEEFAEREETKEDIQETENTSNSTDIEKELAAEIADLKNHKGLVEGHLVGCECVVFIRLKGSLDPVKLVNSVCEEAVKGLKRTRYVQRLTPVMRLERASLESLEKFASIVGKEFETPTSFAVRPNIRNANLNRDQLIQTTAKLVGPGHKVDLHNFEKMILVECFKSVIGLAVVDSRFMGFKRFNLAQIHEAFLQSQTDPKSDHGPQDSG